MIFMGVYRGDRNGSSDDETAEERPDEPHEDQSSLVEQTGPEESSDESDSGDDTSSGAGAAAAAATAVSGTAPAEVGEPDAPVVDEEETESEEETSDDGVEGVEDDETQSSEDTGDGDIDTEECEQQQEDEESDPEQEDSDDDDDDEDDDDDGDDESATVTVTVDPLSAMSWGIQPTLKRVQERYDIELEYDLAPVRRFEDPSSMASQWEDSTEIHSMPVESSLWEGPPDSTELLNQAVLAAEQQGQMEAFLRRLWIHGIAAGQDLSTKSTLTNLADRAGLDVGRFTADMEAMEVEAEDSGGELPVTTVPIKGYTQTWTGYVHYTDFKQQFLFEGRTETPLQPLSGFVGEHGPVATAEVMEVYEWDREEAVEQLAAADGIERVTIGNGEFWV